MDRWVPRRTTKRAGFLQGHRLRKFALARSGIAPPGSPEIFERRVAGERDCPPQSYRERNFRPPGLRKAGFSSSVGIFPSLSKKLWIIGSLHREGRRSPAAQQNFGKRVSASHQDFPRCRGAGSGIPPPGAERIFAGSGFQSVISPTIDRLRKFPLAAERDSPAGHRNGIFDRAEPSLAFSKKVWMAGSLHREGRRSPDAPQGREAGFSESPEFPPLPGSGIPSGERDFRGKRLTVSQRDFPCWGAGFTDLRNSPSLRSGIPPPGSPGSGIFDQERNFPARVAEAGFSPTKVAGSRFPEFQSLP